MINQKTLNKTAKNVQNNTQEARDKNTKEICDSLLKSFQSYANKGELECSLTCILKNNNKYSLQTNEDNTIDILDINEVLSDLEAAGIKVSLTPTLRSNYQKLHASWE